MAINPISVTPYQQGRDLDFSSLAQLPQIWQQGQEQAKVRNTLATLGQGGQVDPMQLIQSGNLTLANLGFSQLQRQHEAARQAEQDKLQRERYGVDDKFKAEQIAISRQNATNNEDYTPEELNQRRLKQLQFSKVDQNSPQGQNFMLTGSFDADAAAGGAGGKAGLAPIYGVKDGKPVIMQMHPSGKAVETAMPDGISISREPIKIDRGTTIDLIDPVTKELIRSIPKDLAGAAAATVTGKETGKAQMALPQLLSQSNQMLKSIEATRTHPGRQWATGVLGTLPGIPGTAQRGFLANLDQLKGKTFLEAFDGLRGGGQITEAEGNKATAAAARLDRAQTKEDFDSALDDLRDVVKAGMMRASIKARGGPAAAAAPQQTGATPAAAGGGVVDYRAYFGN